MQHQDGDASKPERDPPVGNKAFPAVMLTLLFGLIPGYAAITAAGISTANKYSDIKGNWAEQAIAAYADDTVFAGKDGNYFPSKPISRSEFVLMLVP